MLREHRHGDSPERLDDDPFAMTAEEWEMVQQHRWEYYDGELYVPRREDMYDEGREAIHAPDGWAYRVCARGHSPSDTARRFTP